MFNHNENAPCPQVIPGRNGFILSFSNDFQTLLTTAEAYFHLGWSAIPLLGHFRHHHLASHNPLKKTSVYGQHEAVKTLTIAFLYPEKV